MKNITKIKVGFNKSLYIVVCTALGTRFCNLRRSPIILFLFSDNILDGLQTSFERQI